MAGMAGWEAECVIVGGGIGGAVLALALGRQGHRVILLEREPQPSAAVRPEVLAKSTIEVFQRLGAGERILREAAIPLQGLELRRSGRGRLLGFSQDDFRRVGAQPYSTDPARTRQILLEHAERCVEILRGVEVRELLREGTRVAGVRGLRGQESVEVRAALVIGDDGGRSRIREGLGIPLAVEEFPMDFLAAAGPAALPDAIGQAWLNPAGVRSGLFGGIFLPLPGQRVAMVFLLSPASYERFKQSAPSAFYDAAARLAPPCADLVRRHPFPDGFARIRRPFGHAPRYVADGAALLGDAAHPVTPAGGQGANMSVADAAALAEVAHEALAQRDCSAHRLTGYETIRRSANRRSLQFSVRTAATLQLLGALPWTAPLLLWLLSRVERSPATKARFIQAVSQAFRSTAPSPPALHAEAASK